MNGFCKRHGSIATAAALLFLSATVSAATFNYHGKLEDGGHAAEGKYDIELTLYTQDNGGKAYAGPLTVYNVPVHAGSFNVDADFGVLATNANQTWLGVRVRNAGQGDYVPLSTRAAVAVGNATDAVCPGAWTTSGNAGTIAGTGVGQNYLGTADTQPLVLAVGGARVATFSAGQSTIPSSSVVMGYFINSGGNGATVSGGGSTDGGTCPFTFCSQFAPGDFATIDGGIGNTANGPYSVVAGNNNTTDSGAISAVVAGGEQNTASAHVSTIGGGNNNIASAEDATIAGGNANIANGGGAAIAGGTSGLASGGSSAIGGGDTNTASGVVSTIPGGAHNVAGGDASLAAGFHAHVRNKTEVGDNTGDQGTFIWSDESSSTDFKSTGPNQFLVRATGGVGINTAAPFNSGLTVQSGAAVAGFTAQSGSAVAIEGGADVFLEIASSSSHKNGVLFNLGTGTPDGGVVYNDASFPNGFEFRVNGNSTKMAIDSSGKTYNTSGSWTVFSDARLKRDIAPIEKPLDTFLGLHGRTFEYADPALALATPGKRMGFIAQDVETVLPQWVGTDTRGYRMVTPSGFEALAVEAVRALREEKDDEILALHQDNAALRTRLDELTARLTALEARGH